MRSAAQFGFVWQALIFALLGFVDVIQLLLGFAELHQASFLLHAQQLLMINLNEFIFARFLKIFMTAIFRKYHRE